MGLEEHNKDVGNLIAKHTAKNNEPVELTGSPPGVPGCPGSRVRRSPLPGGARMSRLVRCRRTYAKCGPCGCALVPSACEAGAGASLLGCVGWAAGFRYAEEGQSAGLSDCPWGVGSVSGGQPEEIDPDPGNGPGSLPEQGVPGLVGWSGRGGNEGDHYTSQPRYFSSMA
jgi:hypothetical protein